MNQKTSKSSKMLSDEHIKILKVVEALAKEVSELEKGKKVNEEFLKNVIDFIRNYADKFHHAKEEDILFKEFCKQADKGKVHCNPVGQMLSEHDTGRKAIKKIEEGMRIKNRQMIIDGANEYISLIREHIFKEDNILYPMADEALDKFVKEKMFKQFKKINRERDISKQLNFLKSLKN